MVDPHDTSTVDWVRQLIQSRAREWCPACNRRPFCDSDSCLHYQTALDRAEAEFYSEGWDWGASSLEDLLESPT